MPSPWRTFTGRIAPFLSCWSHGTVSCVAVRGDSAFECLALQIVLREGEPDSSIRALQLPCDSEFLLVHWAYPLNETLRLICRAALTSRFRIRSPDGPSLQIHLPSSQPGRPAPSPLGWNTRATTAGAFLPGHPQRTTFFLWASGPQIYPWLDESRNRALDYALANPVDKVRRPTDGLSGWLRRYMPGVNVQPTTFDALQFQVLAPIPFDACYAHGSDQIMVRCPQGAAELVSAPAFYEPGDRAAMLDFKDPATEGALTLLAAPLQWPPNAEVAKVVLRASSTEFARLQVPRWAHAGNLSAAVGTYFDPDHNILHSQLLGEATSGKNQDPKIQDQFEGAVHRLLSLLGLRCVFYGARGSSIQSRPDAAIIETTSTGASVVLVECTTGRSGEKISEKVKDLEERIHGLTGQLNAGSHRAAVDFHGAVFSRQGPLEADWEAAAQFGIGLLGPREIESLFNDMRGPRITPEQAVARLIEPPRLPLPG